MITQYLLTLLWFYLSNHSITLQQRLANRVIADIHRREDPLKLSGRTILDTKSTMLAPPPINLDGKYPNDPVEITSVEVEGEKFFVTSIMGHIGIVEASNDPRKGNGTPEIPTIIEKPNGKFFIKFPGRAWVDIQTLQADDPLLSDLLMAAGNITPPPPPGKSGNGNGGDGDADDPSPFELGDLVTSKSYPQYGIMRVIEVRKIPTTGNKFFWGIMCSYQLPGDTIFRMFFTAASDLVFYGRVE